MCRYLQIYDFNFFLLEPFHLFFYMGEKSWVFYDIRFSPRSIFKEV